MSANGSLLDCFRSPPQGLAGQVLGAVRLDYAIETARRVASFGTYERGFRPAGSEAARRCAGFLADEMRRIGLPQVEVLEFPLDGWEFAGARVEAGGEVFEAVAYGGAAGTGPDGVSAELVDCGTGTAAEYARVDVRGRIALVEMDLDALNWPGVALLEAAHHGAVGVICWPARHYAMLPDSYHCHDLQVACPVPMLNVTREDGRRLRGFGRARLVSTARNLPGATGRNIVGYLPGEERPEELVIIGDHYDAWFDGFMDDAVGVGAVLALARAAVESGCRPRRTLAFVLHDAEEYGRADSPWDWCVGAWAQVSRLKPDWGARAVGAVIFELCGFREAPTLDWYVSPELGPLADDVLAGLRTAGRYPLGKRLYRLVSPWEDSFSYTAAGIPSAANLEIPEYVRSHYYHTQHDTEALLDPAKYALHVAGLGALALRLAEADALPYDLTARVRDFRAALPDQAPGLLFDLLEQLERAGDRLELRPTGAANGPLRSAVGILNQGLTWLGGDSQDETMYPHEQPWRDLQALKAGSLGAVAGMGWGQNVSYPVYRRQLFGHLERGPEHLQWAAGRISPYLDVWELAQAGRRAPKRLLAQAEANLIAAFEHEVGVVRRALEALGEGEPEA